MRKLFITIVLGICSAFAAPALMVSAQDLERITNFDSRIQVHPDASLTVTESITVEVRGFEIKRGIIRELPTRYEDSEGQQVNIWIDVQSVERDHHREPYTVSRIGNGISIRIGDPEVFLDYGLHSYRIVYTTSRQLGFFTEFDELYWNVTGNGWRLPIDAATATVELPEGIAADAISTTAYTGPFGARGNAYTMQTTPSRADFVTTAGLDRGEGLTIVVQWPKGYVQQPSSAQLQAFWLQENAVNLLAVLGVLFVLVYFFNAWRRVGIDPPAGFIVPFAEPPQGLSPAQIRFIRLMGADNKCFTAAIVSIAEKGGLQITALSPIAYSLQKTSHAELTFSEEETALMSALFSVSDNLIISQDNRQSLMAAQAALQRALKLMCEGVYFQRNTTASLIGLLWSVGALAVVIVAAAIPHAQPQWPVLVGALCACLALNLAFAALLPRYTEKGRKILDQVEGFRRALINGVPDLPGRQSIYAERMLPYSIALEVHHEWSLQFERSLAEQARAAGTPVRSSYLPAWYSSQSSDSDLSTLDFSSFTSSFTSSLNSNISSASTPPGSSSGGGGGGSSGGGGGGGGGGGW